MARLKRSVGRKRKTISVSMSPTGNWTVKVFRSIGSSGDEFVSHEFDNEEQAKEFVNGLKRKKFRLKIHRRLRVHGFRAHRSSEDRFHYKTKRSSHRHASGLDVFSHRPLGSFSSSGLDGDDDTPPPPPRPMGH